MLERVEQIIGIKAKNMIISTFHSLCNYFLQREYANFYKDTRKKKFVILDREDQKSVLRTIYKANDLSASSIDYGSILEYISYHKINFISPEELTNSSDEELDEIEKNKIFIYEEYQKTLSNSNSLDFDDLMIKTKEILLADQEILIRWQNKFSYFLIDEFQDTSKLQYEIITLLAKSDNITIVGDPDQTIYSWRGADISFINNFDKLHENTTTITLHQNYRSTKKILNAANNLIKYNTNRLEKNLDTQNPEGVDIQFSVANTQEFETMWIISKINELKKNKVQLKDIAILYRSNYYSRAIEDALITDGIPHKIIGGQKFYERTEIKDALTFLRCIWSPNDIALERVINIPSRKIGSTTLKKLHDFANAKNLDLWESWIQNFKEINISNETKKNLFDFINCLLKHRAALSKKIPIYQVLESFLNEVGYIKYLTSSQSITNTTSRLDNIKELLKAIKTWTEKNRDKNIDDYLEEVALINLHNDDSTNINYISLMTVHAAKGLEFKNVFVIGLNEGVFPTNRALENEKEGDGFLIEEERRLAYVAITRAKERLFLSACRGPQFNNNKTVSNPSQFLDEMGLNLSFFKTEEIDTNKIINFYKDREFSPGTKIIHTNFGEGIVLDVNGDTIVVEFKNKAFGIKQVLKNHKSIERL